MKEAVEMGPQVSMRAVCAALGLAPSSVYRQRRPGREAQQPRPRSHRALNDEQRKQVLDVLHNEAFVDKAPAEVMHTLAEKGEYYCSVRTMYRILDANAEVRERRDQLRHPSYAKPELVATGPNQVWSWDITKLKGPSKWVYYYLYVILDIFSRYVVGWMVAEHENAKLAKRLIEETYEKQGVVPGSLILHADRGSPMKANTTAQLLATLGVERSHSRPHVSNDNPFSESQFKTLKYHPGFPKRFGGLLDTLTFCRSFFPWYTDEHRHSALAYLTPRQVHYDEAEHALRLRHQTLLKAYQSHPERFVHGPPKMPILPTAVWINPPDEAKATEVASGAGVPVTGTVPKPSNNIGICPSDRIRQDGEPIGAEAERRGAATSSTPLWLPGGERANPEKEVNNCSLIN